MPTTSTGRQHLNLELLHVPPFTSIATATSAVASVWGKTHDFHIHFHGFPFAANPLLVKPKDSSVPPEMCETEKSIFRR